MSKTVIVLGGGIGGLSAAHELSERGFSVRVFERFALRIKDVQAIVPLQFETRKETEERIVDAARTASSTDS